MQIFKIYGLLRQVTIIIHNMWKKNQNISWLLLQTISNRVLEGNTGILTERNHMNVAVLRHLEMIDRSLMDSRPTFAAKEQAHTQGAWLAPVNQWNQPTVSNAPYLGLLIMVVSFWYLILAFVLYDTTSGLGSGSLSTLVNSSSLSTSVFWPTLDPLVFTASWSSSSSFSFSFSFSYHLELPSSWPVLPVLLLSTSTPPL
jgi:hypothetical protein